MVFASLDLAHQPHIEKAMTLPPRRNNFRKPEGNGVIRSQTHRKWVRGFCCIVSERKECDEYHGTECAHIRTPGNGGMGRKPSDVFIIPACRIHHHLMHSIGDAEFERRYGVDLVAKALEIASASPVKEIKEAAKAHLAIPAAYQNHNLRKWLRGDDGWPTIPPKNIR